MKPKFLFPSIASLRVALKDKQTAMRRLCSREDCIDPFDRNATPGTDVRLQVSSSGWCVHTGSADYDQDHRGAWGSSFLPYGRANLTDLARDLIRDARDMAWDCQEEEE